MTHAAADENSARSNLLRASQQRRHSVALGPADVPCVESHDLTEQADEAESPTHEHDSSEPHAPIAVVGTPQSDDAQSSRPPACNADATVQDAKHLLGDVSTAGNDEDSALSRESPGRRTFAAQVSVTRPTGCAVD